MSDVPSRERQVDGDQSSDANSEIESSPAQKNPVSTVRPLRIWPVVILLVCLWAARIVPGLYEEMSFPIMMARFMGPLVCAGLIVLWWVFLSRASLTEKASGVVGLATILIITTMLADKTIRGLGTMIYAVPWGISAFAVALFC